MVQVVQGNENRINQANSKRMEVSMESIVYWRFLGFNAKMLDFSGYISKILLSKVA